MNGDRVLVPLPASSEPAHLLAQLAISRSCAVRRSVKEPPGSTSRTSETTPGSIKCIGNFFCRLKSTCWRSRGFTSEFLWRWNAFYFGRQPAMDEAALASWVGLPRSRGAYPTTGLNCYLFSTLGPFESCEIAIVGRTTIVFAASGLVLLAGLALIYLRRAASDDTAGGCRFACRRRGHVSRIDAPGGTSVGARNGPGPAGACLAAMAGYRSTAGDSGHGQFGDAGIAYRSADRIPDSPHAPGPAASSKSVSVPLPSDAVT